MATELAVGGWFASALLQTLVDKASSSALQRFGRQWGLEKELWKLKTSLSKVRVWIGKAEQRRAKEEELADLLNQLKDAAYDADDLLDELEYEQLKLKVEGGRGEQEASLTGFFSPSSLDFAIKFFDRNATVIKIRGIQERIDEITTEMKEIIDLLGDSGGKRLVISVRLETTSFLIETQVFGRDKERDRVIELLLRPGDGSDTSNKNVSVLPLVGMGGVGKTTLAQFIFHDTKVKSHFQLRMWVCVSHPFDVKRVTKEIAEAASGGRSLDLTNFDQIQKILVEKLMNNRFLLVLDDVWNEDHTKWESFCAVLKLGLQGSKILITTRSLEVARIVGAVNFFSTEESILLDGLPDDDYWTFFQKCAFGGHICSDNPGLEAICKKIANKLKGSPLAAKTLGALLNSNLDEQHWRNIMHSEIWELKQGENDIMPILSLSYQYLPACLKQCFAYCSLFPKDHCLYKDELVHMWIAQGFIACQGNERMEDAGSRYFHDLLCRSFFQRHPRYEGTYVMHELLHDLAQSVSRDECFRIEEDKSEEIPETVRHLSVCMQNLEPSKLIELCKHKKLRTLVFVKRDQTAFDYVPDDLLRELISVRVLDLSLRALKGLPDNIHILKHLRYLDLFQSPIQTFPESFCSLYNLQVLRFWRTSPVSFPKGITNLINLRQLEGSTDKVSEIAGIQKLTSLQELKAFKVMKESGHNIKELKHLNQLHGKLCISNLENVESKEEASLAMMKKKKYLDEICLEWTSDGLLNIPYEDILEGLRPQPHLRKLEIRSYGGVIYPSWLKCNLFSSLQTVCLVNCGRLEQLPSLGELPSLKYLNIKGMHAVSQVRDEFYGSTEHGEWFPLLEELQFEDMPEWEEWSGVNDGRMFPRLRLLLIIKCPKLKVLPCLPPSLTKLELCEVGLNALPGEWVGCDDCITDNRMPQGSSTSSNRCVSLSEVSINDCPNLRSLEEWLLPKYRLSLKKIYIRNCVELTSLPVGRFRDLVSLESLMIKDCPKLASVVQAEELSLILPSSLRTLVLNCCGDFDVSLPGCLQNLNSLSELDLRRCSHMTSLPTEVLRHLTALEYLWIKDCANLRSLGNLQLLTSLRQLDIQRCSALAASVPPNEEGLSSLKVLYIDEPLLHKLGIRRARMSSLVRFGIYDSRRPTMFTDGEEQGWFRNLTSLQCLSFINCADLQYLPSELSTISSLKELYIEDCPNLKSMLEDGLPRSLRLLFVTNGHPDLKGSCQKDTVWPKIAHINLICINGEVIQDR